MTVLLANDGVIHKDEYIIACNMCKRPITFTVNGLRPGQGLVKALLEVIIETSTYRVNTQDFCSPDCEHEYKDLYG